MHSSSSFDALCCDPVSTDRRGGILAKPGQDAAANGVQIAPEAPAASTWTAMLQHLMASGLVDMRVAFDEWLPHAEMPARMLDLLNQTVCEGALPADTLQGMVHALECIPVEDTAGRRARVQTAFLLIAGITRAHA